jgi:membrane protease YdiL (CAAX protease family)/Flp pilus assembly protein TadD
VALLDDGTCPVCGQNALEAVERSLPAQKADSELQPVDQQDPEIEACLVDDELGVEAQPLPPSPKFGFFGAVGWCLVLLLTQISLGCVLGVVLIATGSSESLTEDRALLLAVFLAVGELVMLTMGWNQLKPEATRKLAIRGISAIHVFILALLVLPLAVLCEDISNRAGDAFDLIFGAADALQATITLPQLPSGEVAYTGLYEEKFDLLAQQPWTIMFLVGCLLPGVCEEIFFRGFLGRGLLARYGVVGGVTLTSLLFGLFHIDPVHACYTFVMGIVLHCVYLWTRSFWGPVALHTSFNLFGFSTRKLSLDGTLVFGGPDENLWIPLSLLAAALVSIIALGNLLYQSRIRFQMPGEEQTIWSPGYATAAMPPASFEGSTRQGVPRRLSVTMAATTYLTFGLVFLYAASVWFDPNSAWAHINRGILHAEQDEYNEAVVAYTKAIEAGPDLADAYLGRGEAYRMLGELENALVDCKHALDLDPASASGFADRGETYRLLDMTEEAIADCNRAIELDAQLAWAYTVRGNIHSDNGDCQRAIADFRKAIRLERQHAWTYTLLAWELAHCPDERHRDTKEAIRYAERACDLTEWLDWYMLATLAATYAADGQFDQAIRYQRDALKLAPNDAEAEFQDQLDAYEEGRATTGDLSP